MKIRFSSLTPVAALAALGLGQLGGLSYAPEAGAVDTQYWTVTHTLELQELDVTLSTDDPVGVPEIEMTTTHTRTLALEQLHGAAAEGVPMKLRRTFADVEEGLDGEFTIAEESVSERLDASIEIDLQDLSVRFERADADGEWERSFVDEDGEKTDGPEDALAGLTPDADLGGLLKNLKEPEDGATWTADASTLVALVAPGGDLGASVEVTSAGERGMEPALAGLDPLLGMDLHHLLAGDSQGSLAGEIECKVVSFDDAQAVIAIEVDVTATRDVTDRVSAWIEGLDESMPVEVASANANLTATGEGVVTWDLATGLPVAVELELELTYHIERVANLEIPGEGEVVLTSEFDLAGTLESKMTAE
jgi:hypothetical protein